jgi:hypothetical protein
MNAGSTQIFDVSDGKCGGRRSAEGRAVLPQALNAEFSRKITPHAFCPKDNIPFLERPGRVSQRSTTIRPTLSALDSNVKNKDFLTLVFRVEVYNQPSNKRQ